MERREPSITRNGGEPLQAAVSGAAAQLYKLNKAVRVNYSGGLLGLVFGRSRGAVDSVLKKENAKGWNLIQVVPDNPNLVIWLLRLILLIVTLGLWTLSTGHIFIFEKPR